jgi:predicted nucleic acid-binding Zn ribbon protein
MVKRKIGKCKYCGKIKPLRYRDVCDSCYMKLYRAKKREEKRIIRKILWIAIGSFVAISVFLLIFIFKILW